MSEPVHDYAVGLSRSAIGAKIGLSSNDYSRIMRGPVCSKRGSTNHARGLGQRHFVPSLIEPADALQAQRRLGVLHGPVLCLGILNGPFGCLGILRGTA